MTFAAWRSSQTAFTWKAISGNTLSAINPANNPSINPTYGTGTSPWDGVIGQSAVVSKWCGGAFDDANSIEYIFGGGHADSAENTVYSINVSLDNPVFVIRRNPTGAIGNTGNLKDGQEATGVYFDGRPRATHTYNLLSIVDGDLVLWPNGAVFENPSVFNVFHYSRFSHTTNDWLYTNDLSGTLADYGDHYSATCFIPSLRQLWHFPSGNNSNWWRLNVDTFAGTAMTNQPTNSSTKCAVYDSVRNIVLVFGNNANGFEIIDVSNPTGGPYTPTIAGNVPPPYSTSGRGADGWCHDTLNDRFYSRQANDTYLTALIPPASGWSGTWTWKRLVVDPSNSVIPDAPAGNGTYGRIFYSSSQQAVCVVNATTSSMYALAIGTGGTLIDNPSVTPDQPNATPFMVRGTRYALADDASLAMVDGDTMYVDPGYYKQKTIRIRANNATLTCTDPAQKFSIDGNGDSGYWGQAMILFTGNNGTCSHFEVYNVGGGEGVAAVRTNVSGLTLDDFIIRDNICNGILTNPVPQPNSNILVKNGSLLRNASGEGLTHNAYIGRDTTCVFDNVVSNDCNVGHSFKSRAAATTVNNCTSVQGRGSRFLDVPTGGVVVVTNNTACRDSTTGNNRDFVGYGLEYSTAQWATNSFDMSNNSIYDATADMAYSHVAAWMTSGVTVSGPTALGSCTLSGSTPPPPVNPSVTTSALASSNPNIAYSQTLAASGGTSPYTWAIISGSLPTGLSLNASTGVISGTPTIDGVFSFTVRVTDNASNTGSKTLSITINPPLLVGETVWVNDSLPAGAVTAGDQEGWTWVSSSPSPYSGSLCHQSALATGEHQHYFYGASTPLPIYAGDTLFAYVYLDPTSPPTECMLQWHEGTNNWEHRAYWGANSIPFGVDGTISRKYMGALPATGGWVRLEVPSSAVGLEGISIDGMAFTLWNGKATWDKAGKSSGEAPWVASATSMFMHLRRRST